MKSVSIASILALVFVPAIAWGGYQDQDDATPGKAQERGRGPDQSMGVDSARSAGKNAPKPGQRGEDTPVGAAMVDKAVAVVRPTQGNDTQGVVTFESVKNGIRVAGTIRNLSPGKHGFHVHEYGNLRQQDGTSAGGHFAPLGMPHGAPEDATRHVGDLGNIEANENGVAEFEFVDDRIQFHGPASIIGRGLIIHGGEDDLTSQPSGAAGPRVGMAVIGVAQGEQ